MKNKLCIFLLLACASFAQAETVNITWDLNDPAELVTKYTITLDDVEVWAGAAPPVSLTIDPGEHLFALRAINVRGPADPTVVAWPSRPSAPSGIKITVLQR